PETFGQSETESVEEQGLRLVGSDHAANAQLAARIFRQRQYHVGALDTAEFIKNGARAVAQSRAALPLLQRLPQDVSEKAHQDVGLNPVFALMPDGPDRKLALMDAERRLRFAELNVGSPQLL